MKISRLHHVAVICSDYPRSKRFYTEILGLTIIAETFREKRQSYKLDLQVPGGPQIELFSFSDSPPRPSYPEARGLRHLAFAVTNILEAIAGLRTHGVEVEPMRIDETTGQAYTFFADPDGLPLELYEVP